MVDIPTVSEHIRRRKNLNPLRRPSLGNVSIVPVFEDDAVERWFCGFDGSTIIGGQQLLNNKVLVSWTVNDNKFRIECFDRSCITFDRQGFLKMKFPFTLPEGVIYEFIKHCSIVKSF
jgi:hypothetical protein